MGSKIRSGILYTNFDCILLLVVSTFLVGSFSQLSSSVATLYMDSPSREAFLASVDAEEEWLDSISRRLSAGPLPSTSSAGTEPPSPGPSQLPTGATSSPAPSQSESSAGPVRRSARKRKSTADHLDARRQKMATTNDLPVLEQLREMLKEMKEVREDVKRSDTNTSTKIDTLSIKVTDRLNKAELSVKCLSQDMAAVKADLSMVKKKADDSKRIEKIVGDLVDKKLRAPPPREGLRRPRPPFLTGANLVPALRGPESGREEDYLLARRSLKLWPVVGESLKAAVVEFLESKLLLPSGRIAPDSLSVTEVYSPPDAPAQNQVLVRFDNARMRDEVKALGKNLNGRDQTIGIQIEVPDFLRGRYQTFQSLAFQMKKKHPTLKRNIKFIDSEMTLIMDVKLDADTNWKTIQYEDASAVLPAAKRDRTASLSRGELAAAMGTNEKTNETTDDDDENCVDLTSSDENIDKENYSRCTLSFLNTNARSLGPKIESLYDCMHEMSSDLAFITETWYQSNRNTVEELEQFAARFSLGVLHRNRENVARNGRQYGGVAFFYRLATSSFKEFELANPDDHEVIATVGTVKGIKGKVFCLTAYAPPNIPLLSARLLHQYLSDVIDEAKRRFADCTILLAGDFNHWPVEESVEDHMDMHEVQHGSTRGSRSIDRSFTNFNRSITECGTLPPLETEDGSVSDHRVAFAKAVFKRPKPATVTYSYQHFTEKGATKFYDLLAVQSWEQVFTAVGTSAKVDTFQSILDMLMGLCFVTKTTTKRVSDPPWVNSKIRRLSKKRRKVYDREGRSARWKTLKKQCQDLYNQRAANYMEEQKKVLTAPDASRAFFKNVRAYQSKEKPPQFDVRDLYVGKSDDEVAASLADHFNAISSEFDGLNADTMPVTDPGYLPYLSIIDVANRLKKFRKPKSRVKGDIFPCLINRCAPLLATPLTHIYNAISISHEWPSLWKVEYVTPIPKKGTPASENDLRNISCTQLFSKIYESFVLEWLTGQVHLRNNQYGGVKGRSSEMLLVDLWQKILENIEDSRAGSLLTSINYAKAFNRLDFDHCLRCLHTKGANGKLLAIIASFLSGRVMRVKVGSVLSPPRSVLGGVPQGSLLGVFLFNLSIDDFEARSTDVDNYAAAEHALDELAADLPPDLPVPPEPTARDHRHVQAFVTKLLTVLKYVDDNVILEKINFDTVRTDAHSFRTKLAIRTQNLFRRVVHLAESVGMKVHPGKTVSMCIAELKSYIPKAHFFDRDGNEIRSGNSMKILGLNFSSDPDMRAQVESIKKGFRTRKWILHHLRHRGFSTNDLLAVYKSTILPVHDYCSCVFNSSLTLSQASALERLQSQALKSIFGYEYSYRSLLQMSGLQRLQERRDERCLKFARRAVNDDYFRRWFPLNPIERQTRSPLMYQETRARTKRLYNSPLFHMRRLLNGKTA